MLGGRADDDTLNLPIGLERTLFKAPTTTGDKIEGGRAMLKLMVRTAVATATAAGVLCILYFLTALAVTLPDIWRKVQAERTVERDGAEAVTEPDLRPPAAFSRCLTNEWRNPCECRTEFGRYLAWQGASAPDADFEHFAFIMKSRCGLGTGEWD